MCVCGGRHIARRLSSCAHLCEKVKNKNTQKTILHGEDWELWKVKMGRHQR